MSASRRSHRRWLTLLCIPAAVVGSARAGAQHADSHTPVTAASSDLDSLIARAVATSPSLLAARYRVSAARARIGPAGARPDPLLMAGIQNQPLGSEPPTTSAHGVTTNGGPEPMTMHMIGVTQTVPYPGKLALRATVAQRDADAALVTVEVARVSVVHDVRVAYYELAYLDQALRITEQNRTVLADVVRTTESRYAVGAGMQQDVLKARLDVTRLAQDANALRTQRQGELAALNALLDRPSETPVNDVRIPARIANAAIPDSGMRIRFNSDSLGAAVAESPLPALAELQALAIANNPMLREHEARIAAQAARVALAQKAVRPDVDVSLQYGQRNGLTDMVSAVVSVPIPVQRSRKQDEDVAAERGELAALEAEHHAQVNELRARIARLYSDAERERTGLALDVTSILPQAHATLDAATADYQVGKADIGTILQSRSALSTYETSYYRSLGDFAVTIADLEQAVGKEVLP